MTFSVYAIKLYVARLNLSGACIADTVKNRSLLTAAWADIRKVQAASQLLFNGSLQCLQDAHFQRKTLRNGVTHFWLRSRTWWDQQWVCCTVHMQLSSFALRVKQENGFGLTSGLNVWGTHLHTYLFWEVQENKDISPCCLLPTPVCCLVFEQKVRGRTLVVQSHQVFLQGCVSSNALLDIFPPWCFLVQSQEQSLCWHSFLSQSRRRHFNGFLLQITRWNVVVFSHFWHPNVGALHPLGWAQVSWWLTVADATHLLLLGRLGRVNTHKNNCWMNEWIF